MAVTGTHKSDPSPSAQGNPPKEGQFAPEPSPAQLLPSATLSGQTASTLDTVSVALIKWLLFPIVIVASLIGCFLFFGQEFDEDFLVLAIVSFLLASHIFDEANQIGRAHV